MSGEKKGYSIEQMLASKDKKTIPADEPNLGAPKKAPGKKKDKRIVLYLTKGEYETFENLAAEQDLTNSNFGRKIILEYMRNTLKEN